MILDNDIYNSIKKTGWYIDSYGYVYTQTTNNGVRKNIKLHHIVTPVKRGFDIDHINRNKLDNRKSNLRYVTRSENIYNMNEKINNKSGQKGVCFDSRRNRWRSYIGGTKSRIELGSFDDKETAISIRLSAEEQLL